jgi:hypothetical protein
VLIDLMVVFYGLEEKITQLDSPVGDLKNNNTEKRDGI